MRAVKTLLRVWVVFVFAKPVRNYYSSIEIDAFSPQCILSTNYESNIDL